MKFYVDEENVGHALDYTVRSSDTDSFYRAKPIFLFTINQELGGLHSIEKHCGIKDIYEAEKKTWMILRTRMEIESLPLWTDDLECTTWCQEGYKLYGPRFIDVKDTNNGKKVFSSLSYWLVMDLEKNRPARPNVFEDRLPPADKEKHFVNPDLPPLPKKESFPYQITNDFPVAINYYDTDYNRHVNNLSYINWVLDVLPHNFLDEYMPSLIDVKWEKQSFLDDSLVVRTYADSKDELKKENPKFLSEIVRIKDDKEEVVFTSYSEWKKRGKENK